MHNSMQMSPPFSLAVTGIFSHSCAFGVDVLEAPLAEWLDLEIEPGILDLLSKIITFPHEHYYTGMLRHCLCSHHSFNFHYNPRRWLLSLSSIVNLYHFSLDHMACKRLVWTWTQAFWLWNLCCRHLWYSASRVTDPCMSFDPVTSVFP